MWNDRHYFLEHGPAAPPRQGPGHEPIWHLLDVIAGSQQKIGRRNDNADIRMLGYNDNTIWIQRSVSCQSGNARGGGKGGGRLGLMLPMTLYQREKTETTFEMMKQSWMSYPWIYTLVEFSMDSLISTAQH